MHEDIRTSETHPIRVDFLPADAFAGADKLGMTFAPGKHEPGLRPWRRDLEADLRRLSEVSHIATLVCLLEDAEISKLGIQALFERAAAFGMEVLRFPIAEFHAPRSRSELDEIVMTTLDRLDRGRVVAVHCRGGMGRTGLVVAACLVARGHAPAGAIALVRSIRRGALETREQEQCVAAFTP